MNVLILTNEKGESTWVWHRKTQKYMKFSYNFKMLKLRQVWKIAENPAS